MELLLFGVDVKGKEQGENHHKGRPDEGHKISNQLWSYKAHENDLEEHE